jgi:two-component system, cell cycle response regulator DivK
VRRIAIIDDVEDNLDLLYHVLSDLYDVSRYAQGKEALAGFPSNVPDLVILDVSLPDIDGFEVLRRMRQEQALGRVPVIAVTAHAMKGDREKCLTAGFTDYVAKPILDIDDFLNRIAGHIARASGPESV